MKRKRGERGAWRACTGGIFVLGFRAGNLVYASLGT